MTTKLFKEYAEDGRAVERPAPRAGVFLSPLAERSRALWGLKQHAQDGGGVERPAPRAGVFLSPLAERSRALCALSWAVFATVSCLTVQAAEPAQTAPLAYSSAPPCSKRPGVRAIRSDLVQLGGLTASLSGQAIREGPSCLQSGALWLTRKGISQQFELHDAAQNIFAIIDVAPDSSSILLASIATFPNPEDDHSAQMAILTLPEGPLKWTPISDILGFKNCDASIEPEGYLDATHVLITAIPQTSAHKHASCTDKPLFFSFDTLRHTAKPSATAGVQRFAQSVSGPLQSCKSDPDVIGACYTKRARLSVTGSGGSLLLWPLGENRVMAVEEDMLPSNLISKVTPTMRVYATMVICPLLADQPARHSQICIDSATNLHPDPVLPKVHTAVSKPGPVNSGESH